MIPLTVRRLSRMSTTIPKLPISALPLPDSSQLLAHNLTPDTHTPSVSEFRKVVLPTHPSLQRRARLLSPQSHFSYVLPLPLGFPYQIEAPDEPETGENKGAYVERWLAAREAVHERPPLARDESGTTSPLALRMYYPENRDQTRDLIGLSETGLKDCLPHLDVGDAFTSLGAPTLTNSFDDIGDGVASQSKDIVSIREELVDVLSGHAILMSPETQSDTSDHGSRGFAPWSLRYSGHQFGSWAGQLGDGRATSILVTPHPKELDATYEIQLKGAGRTPFSRSADGLAVLRSSIREFLCSEAMHALGIPTTRSLSLISLPELSVYRERVETACVLARVAPSFLRIGSFEALHGPTNMFFFGGGQQEPHWEGLRLLGEWVSQKVLKLGGDPGEAWGTRLVLEVARRNAKMVAGWQAYGFMHGVINTDNVSILGLTIDYGPYAFMDVFDPSHICNHTDEGGRYAYMYQPNMIIYALRALLDALAPLIGAEHELGQKAVGENWAARASKGKLDEWRKKGIELVKDEMERVAQEATALEYGRLMRKRLALHREDKTDGNKIFKPLLDLMQNHKLDFHSTFRKLTTFRPSFFEDPANGAEAPPALLQEFITQLLKLSPETENMDHGKATTDWLNWLDTYAQRIESERNEWDGDLDLEREKAAKAANPRFVLRQWVLEEVIAKVERDSTSGKRVLAKVLHMACNPFESWGAEDDSTPDGKLDAEIKEERRYCGMGEKKMLGFQCSCSS